MKQWVRSEKQKYNNKKNTMKRKEERTTVKDKDYLDVGKREKQKGNINESKRIFLRKEMRKKKELIRKGERLG